MTELLKRAVAAMEELPDDIQDAIAARLLQEIADERAWAKRFTATSDEQWSALAQSVREAISSQATIPLEDLLPPA
jgi:hypothetical protein